MNLQKDLLAKLLATENIEVVHKNTETASFNVKDRVLTLPIWENMESYTYDHLVGHEVGHALFTPYEGWHDALVDDERGKGYKSFLNVIEDARIEKLIQRRYPGLRRDFIKSYKKMLAEGFFGTDLEGINNYKLIDRINVYFKCGSSIGVRIENEEKHWVTEIENAETWEEVKDIADRMYDEALDEFKKEQEEKEENESEIAAEYEEEEDGESIDIDGESENEEGEDDISASTDADDIDSEDDEQFSNRSAGAEGPESLTDDKLRDNIESEFNETIEGEVTNIYIPEKDVSNRIVDYKHMLKTTSNLDEWITSYSWRYTREMTREEEASELYKKFLNNNKKTINYLVKEFEMKKSATAYARATTSKTGVIDPVLMNSYKYNDDIFKKVTNIPEGKSHGMIMYLDWSGSMVEDMKATIDQTLNLVHFCRQVNIPFRVYAFSDRIGSYNKEQFESELKNANEGEIIGHTGFRLIEFFNNKMNKQQFARMSKVLLACGEYINHLPTPFHLGGTPLNDTIAYAHKVEELFQRVNKVDIVNAIFLTDGDSYEVCYASEATNHETEEKYMRVAAGGHYYRQDRVYLVDTVTKKRTKINDSKDSTRVLLKNYAYRTGANVIGFRILPNSKSRVLRDLEWMGVGWGQSNQLYSSLLKEKYVHIPGCGYDKFFGIKGGKELQTANGSFEVADDAKKGAILRAFKKANNSKIVSRSLLNEFIKEVA